MPVLNIEEVGETGSWSGCYTRTSTWLWGKTTGYMKTCMDSCRENDIGEVDKTESWSGYYTEPVPDLVMIQADSDSKSRVVLSQLYGLSVRCRWEEFSGCTPGKSWHQSSIFSSPRTPGLNFFLHKLGTGGGVTATPVA